MWARVELSDVQDVALVLEDGSFVVVDIKVVGRREEGHDRREPCRPSLAVHTVPGILRFVGSYDGKKLVALKELTCCLIAEVVRGCQSLARVACVETHVKK